ncbi:MAG: hypothetical protein ABMA25_10460 [Ilumatobacteraceae bacterium]
MSRMFKPLAALCLAAAAVSASVPVANAAPPSNDNYNTPLVITAGQSYPVSTIEATTSALETIVGSQVPNCGGSAVKGVWFSYTPPVNQSVAVTLAASSFSAHVAWVTGTPPNVGVGACGVNMPLTLQKGQNYRFLVYGTVTSQSGLTQLTLSVQQPPTLTATVSSAKLAAAGKVQVKGTYRCATTSPTGLGSFVMDVAVFSGNGGAGATTVALPPSTCDNTVRAYSVLVSPAGSTPYAVGPGEVHVSLNACNAQGGLCNFIQYVTPIAIT